MQVVFVQLNTSVLLQQDRLFHQARRHQTSSTVSKLFLWEFLQPVTPVVRHLKQWITQGNNAVSL